MKKQNQTPTRPVFSDTNLKHKTGLKNTSSAFTLVELIVVITILAILWTIAFISLQWFSRDARDSARISDLKNIEKALELTITKWSELPDPADKVSIMSWSTLIWYQWYMSKTTAWTIWVHWEVKDPLDNIYYTYSTNANKTKYQLLWFLENNTTARINLINKANASTVNYTNRYTYTVWNPVGIILNDTTKEPLHQIITIPNTNLDLTDSTNKTTPYTAIFSNDSSNFGTIANVTWANLPTQIRTITNNVWVVVVTPVVPTPTCSDWIQNWTETGIDCGGYCGACPTTCSDWTTTIYLCPEANGSRFTAWTDIVTDNVTWLMWQKDWSTIKNWDNAKAYCADLNLWWYTDWRLPDLTELFSIADYSRSNPAIDTSKFTNTANSYYWSSTTYSTTTSYAWLVYFSYAYSSYTSKTTDNYVRCIR